MTPVKLPHPSRLHYLAVTGISLLAAAFLAFGAVEMSSLLPGESTTDDFAMAMPLTHLPVGTRITGTLSYGQDLSRPTVYFKADTGVLFSKVCNHEQSPGCTTILFQAAFAQQGQAAVVDGVTLTVVQASQSQTAYLLSRGAAPFLELIA